MEIEITKIQNKQKYDDVIIFQDKSLSDMIKQIYGNNKQRINQLNDIIKQLIPQLADAQQAHITVQFLSQFLSLGIKNDQVLVKVIGIIQKYQTEKVKLQYVSDQTNQFSDIFKQIQSLSKEDMEINKQFEQKFKNVNMDELEIQDEQI